MVANVRKKILVVEDEPELCELVAQFLAGEGHDVREALGGYEALVLCQAGDFDLIVTDYTMPRFGGSAYLRALRERAGATPIIVMTTAVVEVDRLLAEGLYGLHEGITLLAKPFQAFALLDHVNRIFAGEN